MLVVLAFRFFVSIATVAGALLFVVIAIEKGGD
jgi:hypothetical protein